MESVIFEEFPKIARLNRECVISEKIDGTNGQIIISESGEIHAASRSRLITPEDDNYGFARWVDANKADLLNLGPGRHFGEWWGQGIQRKYVLTEKRFSLFNTDRWSDVTVRPECCSVVPTLYRVLFSTQEITRALENLRQFGSHAAPGFMKPEGVIVWHVAARNYFKATLEKGIKPLTDEEAAFEGGSAPAVTDGNPDNADVKTPASLAAKKRSSKVVGFPTKDGAAVN